MVDRPTQRETPLADATAVVTGASSGIGAATARVLAADGADVVVAARRTDRLENLATEIEAESDATAHVVPTDVTDPEAVAALAAETEDTFGGIDVVVANAGVGIASPVAEMSDETYERMRGVNVDGMFYTARETIPALVESRGNLVFVGSMAGQHPRPANPVYAATKWWTRGFAASLQASLGDDGVAVTCVNPTEVRTEFGSESGTPAADAHDPESVTEPIEVADAISFAVRQRSRNSVTSLDLYRRDKLTHF
ncbi:SDR family oxidoreductase [Halobaculum sp. MBLA0147]|uniref:SDR family oxidoreductase n=1 Tax=Halobaculum sp. MBLA0147 TaxID=3079934 RepID=UPI00352352A3